MSGDELYREFVRLFDGGKYFEAHEVLEEAWRAAEGGDKLFYQGLIQVAVALHHHSRQNASGARTALAAAADKLRKFPGSHRGLDLKKLLEDAQARIDKNAPAPLLRPAGEKT